MAAVLSHPWFPSSVCVLRPLRGPVPACTPRSQPPGHARVHTPSPVLCPLPSDILLLIQGPSLFTSPFMAAGGPAPASGLMAFEQTCLPAMSVPLAEWG